MGPFEQHTQQKPPRYGRYILLGFVVLAAASLLLKKRGGVFTRHPSEPPVIVTTGTVQANDVFSTMLVKKGVQSKYINPIDKELRKIFKNRSIQPKDLYEVTTTTDNIFLKLVYRTDPIHSFVVSRSSGNVFSSETVELATTWKERRIQATVTSFLEKDLQDMGFDSAFVSHLTWHLSERIFAWRIDFYTEQRKGDKLDMLFEQEYIVGSPTPMPGTDHIRVIYASYTGSGTKAKVNAAVRYQASGASKAEYFDNEGHAVERPFLRAPFTKGAFRVSSGFNPKRLHPILRVYRPHHGTDYAAARGTPVAAIGKGTVVRAEPYKGYGNCIDIRHSNVYTSRYGHLSRIAVRRGQSISQGQYIGNVGSTGLSTGPHLHFEMLVNGSQMNFLRMNFPPASSVSKADMADFTRVRDEAVAHLTVLTPINPKPTTDKASS